MFQKGVYTALITPFLKNQQIDWKGFERVIEKQVGSGVAGVIPSGTTGESPTLSTSEKKKMFQVCRSLTRGTSVKVVAGTGTNATDSTIEMSLLAQKQKSDGLLIVTPYYNKPSQAGLLAHYRAVADAVSVPIMLYNAPGRTGVGFTTKTVCELAKHEHITAIKEASGSVPFFAELMGLLGDQDHRFRIFTGDDPLFLPTLSLGGAGVVSVASNLIPATLVSIFESATSGHWVEAQRKFLKHYPLFRDLFIETNPGPIKFLMEKSKQFNVRSDLRLPLVQVSKDNQSVLLERWSEIKV